MWIKLKFRHANIPTCRRAKIWCNCIQKFHFFSAFGVWLLSIWSNCQHADLLTCRCANVWYTFFKPNHFFLGTIFQHGCCLLGDCAVKPNAVMALKVLTVMQNNAYCSICCWGHGEQPNHAYIKAIVCPKYLLASYLKTGYY